MPALRPGEPAPDFTLTNFNGTEFTLSRALRHGPVVRVFYPLDNPPRCTKLLCTINEETQEFKRRGLQVVEINSADETSHERFAERRHLAMPLLSDHEALVAARYDAVFSIGPIRVIRYTCVGVEPRGNVKFFRRGRPANEEILAEMEAV